MNTMQFLMSILNWLQADPSHVVVAAALLNSIVPTPVAGTTAAKLYKIVELLALSFFRAKDTGVPPVSSTTLAQQIAVHLEQSKQTPQ